ncbi:PEP/pyruvate-binding domain-containing protein [Cellulomonas sp. Y8]|uniref:PEP/pyruvate-binding domain-containing protein n=1 Tax=Cellulomonas sp. Y8 TaxID=2591145 RepID=UPI0011CB6567|nr:PEP/pyruvate-binding domain-containing protein [Cellulomonas sp. Y8]
MVTLRDAGPESGAKARTLGRLLAAGFRVPDGVVVPRAGDAGWPRHLPGHLRALGGDTFAVRSSAAVEDAPGSSYAGQFRTLLHVRAADVVAAVREVAAATAAAATYATALGAPTGGGVAVLVQPMLVPAVAGVAFTRHPVTGARATVVEAVPGLADRLASGDADPERWHVDPGRSVHVERGHGVLDPGRVRAVADVAERVEGLLGGGQDVEWAVDADGAVWTLQARPITAWTAAVPGPRPGTGGSGVAGAALAVGTPSAPGAARGRVRVLRGLDDLPRFRPGEVLVCRATSPAWTPALARAAAVVTEVGGLLSHAAIVARELGVPAVTGVRGARDLPEGAPVVVDGTAGTVRLAAS